MLKFVHERVLTMDFVTTAIADLEGKLSQQASSVRARLEDTHRRLDEVEKSINVLLGLAEQFGAGSAGARLVEREAERKELEAEMRYLEGQRDAQRLTAPTEILQALLTEMQETLWGTNIKAKRRLLKKIIVWVKLERESEGR